MKYLLFLSLLWSNSFKMKDEVPLTLDSVISGTARHFHLKPKLVKSVIRAESNWNPLAKSKSGAIGLMQVLNSTASFLGMPANADLYDPKTNIWYGCMYLSMMLKMYHGNLNKALMAYNGGPGNLNLMFIGELNSRTKSRMMAYSNKVRKYNAL